MKDTLNKTLLTLAGLVPVILFAALEIVWLPEALRRSHFFKLKSERLPFGANLPHYWLPV